MIYFGERQVGKTHIAIEKLVKAYNNKKGKILIVAPKMEQAGFIRKLLVGKKVDIKDIIITNVLPLNNRVNGFTIDYRYIEDLGVLITDDPNTFVTVNRATLIVRHDEKYSQFLKEYNPDTLQFLDNSLYTTKEEKEQEIFRLKERIKKLEQEILPSNQ